MGFEVVTRWGDELLDVQYVDARCRIADVDIELVDGATGKIGHVDYTITKATRQPRSLPYAGSGDRHVAPYLGIALAVHLVVWGVATQRTPEREPPRIIHTQPRPHHVTKSFANAPYTTPDVSSDDDSEDAKAPGAGVPMLLGDRAAGSPEVTRARGHIAVEEVSDRPQLANNAALEDARHAGVLGSEAVTRADAFKAVMGSADLSSGFDGASINSALHGGELAAHGQFGLSYRGDASGGGGTQWATIGVASHGAFSNGRSAGRGWGGQPIWAPTIPRGTRWIAIDICGRPFENHCTHFGTVDERVIRRIVRRHRDKLAYCYEKRALAKTDLATGPLLVDFAIARDGRVTQVSAKGLDDEVAACVADVYAKIAFPRMPETGVQVRHALVYSKST